MLVKTNGGALMKTLSIFLALVNSLLAGLLITYSLSAMEIRHVEISWSAIKIAGAVMVIAIGALTWISSIRGAGVGVGLLFLGDVFLIVLGAVTAVWTFHRAIVSGDMEYYMIGYGASLMAQGMSSLLGFIMVPDTMTIS
jgi:hypothetical protein